MLPLHNPAKHECYYNHIFEFVKHFLEKNRRENFEVGRYRNFKMVIYCTAQNMNGLTREALERQYAFFDKYCGCDKVYIEPYRDGLMLPEEQLSMLKVFFTEKGVEIAGALTTTCPDLSEEDVKKQRFGGTYCYTNQAMRDYLVKTVAYTARHFDEFIIDDWFFTYCTCEECRAAKGDRSWEDFRTAQLAEVSENLIMKTAKAVNPNCKVIIKYPNWSESYQESGYDPDSQRHLFDGIYTGTETRNTRRSDQHLPKYCSFSLMRLMENYAPGHNGGGWFDPYGCSPMELYLEQAYLTALSRGRELCAFCWSSLYRNKVIAPLGMELELIDKALDQVGDCIGVPCYLPPRSQGEDHLEDFLGMNGIPVIPTPDFPAEAPCMLLTVRALKDPDILKKLQAYVAGGGKAIVSSGFVLGALGSGIEEITSIRFRGRRFATREFIEDGMMSPGSVFSREKMEFPLLEHRNNTTWALAKAVCGEENYPLVLRDTYGQGQMVTLVMPDEYGRLYDLPAEVLRVIRAQFTPAVPYYLDSAGSISLFPYEGDTFCLYPYVNGYNTGRVRIITEGAAEGLEDLLSGMVMKPESTRIGMDGTPSTVFSIPMLSQGDLRFFRIRWAENRYGQKVKRSFSSAPNDVFPDP